MGTYLFALEETRYAYAWNKDAPDGAWSQVSRHTTLSAARKALARHDADMAKYCGPTSWSHNHRLVALRDVPLAWDLYCDGWQDAMVPGAYGRHRCDKREVSKATWREGRVREPEPPLPEGWASHCQCSECAAHENASLERYDEVYNARR